MRKYMADLKAVIFDKSPRSIRDLGHGDAGHRVKRVLYLLIGLHITLC